MCQYLIYYIPFDGGTGCSTWKTVNQQGKLKMGEGHNVVCGEDRKEEGGVGLLDGESVRSEWGKAVATAALKEMHPGEDEVAERPIVDEAEVKAFIDECTSAGADVIEVVGHIAKREGIDLMESIPKDVGKAKMWSFLLSVLKTWIIDMAQFAVKMMASGEFDWKSFIQDYVNDRIGMIGFKSKESEKAVCAEKAEKSGKSDKGSSFGFMPIPLTGDMVLRIVPYNVKRYVVVR